MPTISMFYGILVAMFFEDSDRHNLPHLHVRYAGKRRRSPLTTGACWRVVFRPSN